MTATPAGLEFHKGFTQFSGVERQVCHSEPMGRGDGGSRWTDALLDRMRGIGDPVADESVAAVLDRGGVAAVNDVMHTLVRANQPAPESLPAELREYLTTTLPLPDWADPDKIRRGQQLFETWGLYISVCLFCCSLPSAYAAADGVQVLHMTMRLDTDARRRVMETGQFLIDVLSVDGLEDNGTGRRTIQRVRLMHAAVRHLIEARREQDPEMWNPDWGTPINQEDLAGTMLSFSDIVAGPLPKLGVRVPREDAEAYLHLWNVIAHLLGLREEMRVHDLADAGELVEAIKRRHFRASPEGREMTAALLDLLDELTPTHGFDATIPPLVRYLVGKDTADLLDVPPSGLVDDAERIGGLARLLYRAVIGDADHDPLRYDLITAIVRPFGRELMSRLFALERGGDRAQFDIPDHLAARWELSR